MTNPQFGSRQFGGAAIVGNLNNSTYHSMQLGVTKRLSSGYTASTSYTWSRTLATTIVDPRNRSTKTLQAFHRTHDFRTNGTWQLPFGPNRKLLSNAPGWVSRIVERWQLGTIFSWNSGAPLSFTTSATTPNPFQVLPNTNNFPDIVGELPKGSGQVSISTTSPGRINYFEGLTRVQDPGRNSVTTEQNLRTANGQFAIADAQGTVVLVNPALGKIGNMGQNWIEGPGQIGMDANLLKRVRISETKEFEIRIDAINILNHPNFGNPTTDINNVNFGVIGLPTTGNRTFTFHTRLNF